MSKCRIYGNEKTHLTLTDKAFAAYSVTDPLTIVEFEDDTGMVSYSMHGAVDRGGMTEESVNAILENLVDDDEILYVTVSIPNTAQYWEMVEHFSMNGYNMEHDPEVQTISILEDEFPWAETCFEDHGTKYEILF